MPARDTDRLLPGIHRRSLADGRTVFRVVFRIVGNGNQQHVRQFETLEQAVLFRNKACPKGRATPDALIPEPVAQPATVLTVAEYIDNKWTPWATVNLRGYRNEKSRVANYIRPAFGDLRLDNVLAIRDAWLRLMEGKARSLAPKTQRTLFALAHSIFQRAVDAEKIITVNPLAKSPGAKTNPIKPPNQRSTKRVTFTPEQFQDILNATPKHHRPVIWFFALTSLRCSEVAALTWADYDEAKGILHITRGAVRGHIGPPKTDETIRDIRVTPFLAGQLQDQRAYSTIRLHRQPRPADFIFATKNGRHFNGDSGRKHILYPAMRRAGLEIKPRAHGFHCFRHSAATALVNETGNVAQAQKHLGHSNIKTTMLYTHIEPDELGTLALEKHYQAVTQSDPAAVTPQTQVIQ